MEKTRQCNIDFVLGEIMESKGWTPYWLAAKIGVPHQVVYGLRNYPNVVRMETLEKLCGGPITFRLSKLMGEKGWNQADVVKMTGLSQPTVSRLFHRPQSIWMETLAKLCNGCGIGPEELFEVGVRKNPLVNIEDLFKVSE